MVDRKSMEMDLSVPSTIRVLLATGRVTELKMETYLAGVVAAEMGAAAPLEALKAQAVASRTYAVSAHRHPESGADVCTTSHCQRWRRVDPIIAPEVFRAVSETWGMLATHGGKPIDAFFFEHCDGRTRNAHDLLMPAVPYLQSVQCECGFIAMKGHGVGVCQRGAIVLARRGVSFERILQHYYTGVTIVTTSRERVETAAEDTAAEDTAAEEHASPAPSTAPASAPPAPLKSAPGQKLPAAARRAKGKITRRPPPPQPKPEPKKSAPEHKSTPPRVPVRPVTPKPSVIRPEQHTVLHTRLDESTPAASAVPPSEPAVPTEPMVQPPSVAPPTVKIPPVEPQAVEPPIEPAAVEIPPVEPQVVEPPVLPQAVEPPTQEMVSAAPVMPVVPAGETQAIPPVEPASALTLEAEVEPVQAETMAPVQPMLAPADVEPQVAEEQASPTPPPAVTSVELEPEPALAEAAAPGAESPVPVSATETAAIAETPVPVGESPAVPPASIEVPAYVEQLNTGIITSPTEPAPPSVAPPSAAPTPAADSSTVRKLNEAASRARPRVHVDHLPGARMIAGCLSSAGIVVQIVDARGNQTLVFSGSAPHYGEGGFETLLDEDGRYMVSIDGQEIPVDVQGDTVFIHA